MPALTFRNPPGRSEAFVEIEVNVSDEPAEFDPAELDYKGRRRWAKTASGCTYAAFKGTATIAWKDAGSRVACLADHERSDERRRRWRNVQAYAARMSRGEFPAHAHTYLIDESGEASVLDGTRRMLAYLESGHEQMPVVVVVLRRP